MKAQVSNINIYNHIHYHVQNRYKEGGSKFYFFLTSGIEDAHFKTQPSRYLKKMHG